MWIVGLPLATYIGWQSYIGFTTRQTQAQADAIVRNMPELAGYPVKARVERGSGAIWVVGLTPSEASRIALLGRLKELAPQAVLSEAVSVLPKTDVESELRADGLRRSIERAERRLETVGNDLDRIGGRITSPDDREAVDAAKMASERVSKAMKSTPKGRESPELIDALHEAIRRMRVVADRLAAVVGSSAGAASLAAGPYGEFPKGATESAEVLALSAERIGSLAVAIEQSRIVAPLDARLVELARRFDGLKFDPSPRQRLESFVRSHAVFFADGATYRNPELARKTANDLASLLTPTSGSIRVVGYTDEAGQAARNSQLSLSRAERVIEDLVAAGIPRRRLIALGRATGPDISTSKGLDSPNRRVEFEIGFDGEEAQ